MKARGRETMLFYVLFIRWLLPALSESDTASQQYLNMKSRRNGFLFQTVPCVPCAQGLATSLSVAFLVTL